MTDPLDSYDHERHLRRALELAREASARGDEPFGSVLVHDDAVVMAERNAVVSANDLRRHPELRLAERAHRELPADIRSETVLYTSTEPCAMCTGGIHIAGLAGVVYGVGTDVSAHSAPDDREVPTVDIDSTPFVGPVLEAEARTVHEECWPDDDHQ